MQCAVHSNQEAVGICKACGAAVCPRCRSVIGGITYCYNCTLFHGWLALRLGRYHPPPVRKPKETLLPFALQPPPPLEPADAVTQQFYRIGVAGLVLFGVSLHLVWAFGLFGTLTSFLWGRDYLASNLLLTVGFGLLAIGMALSGFAFLALQRHFGIGYGFAAAASSFLFAWWPVTADLLKYTRLVYSVVWPAFPGPLFPAYVTLQGFGLTMILVTLFLWTLALSAVRRPSQQNSVALNACALIIMVILFAVFLVPIDLVSRAIYIPIFFPPAEFFLFFVLALLLEPATLLIALLLRRVSRGITEMPTVRQRDERPGAKSAEYALQWVRR